MLKIKKLQKADIDASLKIILGTHASTNKKEAKWLFERSLERENFVLKPIYYVLCEDNKVVGVSGLYQDYEDINSVRWLDYLAVSPKFQRHGYGTMMLKNLEKICKKEKVNKLCVFTDNQKAINFYEKNNFEIFGKIENYYADNSHKTWLYKNI
jgi:RimJ/RimL family protein N-acetyltransferase